MKKPKPTPSSLARPTSLGSLRAPSISPARLTAEATLKLPRWGLVALCLLYILPGLIGRDPWKSEDATAFGVMWTMAHGAGHGGVADWLLPNVFGAPITDSGPLMYWVGALAILAFGKIMSADLAARLATVAFFFVTVTGVWYATYLVCRRKPAQPVALAFGGQPESRDYGRVLADGALLILLATVGLLIRAHESSSDVAMLGMLATGLYGMARSIEEPKRGAGWIGVAIVGLVYSRGPEPALALALLWIVLVLVHGDFKAARGTALLVTLPIAIVGLALWPLATIVLVDDGRMHVAQRIAEWRAYFDGIDAQAANKLVRTLPWSTWIAWPLAIWGVWSWRDRLREAHIALPLGFVLAMVLALCTTSDTSDGQLLLVLPGLVMLAAIGLPTLRRGGANAFDWFSLLLYSVAAALIWFTWFTKMTGTPAGFARSLARLTPGAPYAFEPVAFALALLATVAWITLVRWRIVSHPKVVWRSVVLASGGVILAWALTSTLFIRTIDRGRTYRDVSASLVDALRDAGRARTASKAAPVDPAIPGGSCVATDGVGLAQRASFAWFGGVRFAHVDYDGHNIDECDYLLRQDTRSARPDGALPAGKWRELWEGRRAADRDERFRLFRKVGTSSSTRGPVDAIERNDARDAPFNTTPAQTPPAPPAPSDTAPR